MGDGVGIETGGEGGGEEEGGGREQDASSGGKGVGAAKRRTWIARVLTNTAKTWKRIVMIWTRTGRRKSSTVGKKQTVKGIY